MQQQQQLPRIERHLPEIRALCREFGVVRLEVFGSAVSGDFDPDSSDIDFLVEYPDGYQFGDWGARHFELKERLEALFGHNVDLIVMRNLINPFLIASINASRQLLY